MLRLALFLLPLQLLYGVLLEANAGLDEQIVRFVRDLLDQRKFFLLWQGPIGLLLPAARVQLLMLPNLRLGQLAHAQVPLVQRRAHLLCKRRPGLMITLRDLECLHQHGLLVPARQILRLHDQVYVVLVHLALSFQVFEHLDALGQFHALGQLLLQLDKLASHQDKRLLDGESIGVHREAASAVLGIVRHVLKRLLHAFDLRVGQLEEDVKDEGAGAAHLLVENGELLQELLVEFLPGEFLIFNVGFNGPEATGRFFEFLDLL